MFYRLHHERFLEDFGLDRSTWLELALACPPHGETAEAANRRQRLWKEQQFPAPAEEVWETWAHFGKFLGECLPLWFATGLVDVDDAIEKECPPTELSPEKALEALRDKLDDFFGEKKQAYLAFVKVPRARPGAGEPVQYRLEKRATLVPPSSEHMTVELYLRMLLGDALADMTATEVVYRACGYCGRIFKGERSTARYCSTSCRTLALRRRRREAGK